MSLLDFFRKPKEDLEFIDCSNETVVYSNYPPVLAKHVKPLFKQAQLDKYGEYSFPSCPGMHDYSRMGYIIPAWTNINVKANKAGCFASVGSLGKDAQKRGTPVGQPMPMATDITHGLLNLEDGIDLHVWNFPAAWKIMGGKNVSALILPPIYHTNYTDDLFVYPGIVDYANFSTINFICSPKRKCEVIIKAGEPLLHVIPFITNNNFVASYGPGTREQKDSTKLVKWFHEKNFYRRFCMVKKKFSIHKKVPPS